MRHLNEYQHHLRVLLEPYDAKVSRTVLRGESPSNGADLLDSTLDARHLICNISERLGKNYIGHNRSQFIKALFAETCYQLEEPAIYKNIKERPLEGHIKYDKPDEGSIAFHYELLEQSI